MYENKNLLLDSKTLRSGKVAWRSPSNIALIKYWGKHGRQLPQNPSISFTLNNAYSETEISYEPRKDDYNGVSFDFYFEGKKKETFNPKIEKFLLSIVDIFPFLNQLHLKIDSKNSFPHSAGIASSASAMSAISLCLCSIEVEEFEVNSNKDQFFKKASYVSRLGSGSACRSVYPIAASWGKTVSLKNSSDEYAIPYEEFLHPIFKEYNNDILLVSNEKKDVSSSKGHALMENNVYSESRYKQARLRFTRLHEALRVGDLETFGGIVESEALTLHALMMASFDPFILIQPNTLKIIQLIKAFRRDTKIPLYFSLDAGPNPHLMYPNNVNTEVKGFINDVLKDYCKDGYWIADRVGEGPSRMMNDE